MLISFDMDILELADKVNVSTSDALGNELVKGLVEILSSSPFIGLDTDEIAPNLLAKCIQLAAKRALRALEPPPTVERPIVIEQEVPL